ncbi:MFS transporter [Acinetobacter rudis]|uniref:MFS transporter n=2 Tax=Acinetobacter rudis TaxID=632955 RepID=A0AAW8JAL7_9GAMM|nr:MFS transporter [Acinetobacter rudis]MDQ8935721.1 MFS transporter [Acinetobacter rudis]MDQ9017984.1 MFS transporter [Acinetobacter rudis]
MKIKKLIMILGFLIVAAVCGVLIAIWVFKHFNIYIPLENQAVNIELQEALKAKVTIHDALDVDVTGNVQAVIPVNEQLTIPVNQTLMPHVYFDNMVPIKTTIPVKEVLKVEQDMPIDTKVKVNVFGKDLSFPLKGVIPIKMDVPIELQVPLDQAVHLKFDSKVRTDLKESLRVPLVTTLDTQIPINGRLNVPVKTPLNATVNVENVLPVKIQQGNLKIPLNSVKLLRDPMSAPVSHPVATTQP